MRPRSHHRVLTRLILSGALCTAALASGTAFAAKCPPYGQTTLIGSCEPREPCYKRVVILVIEDASGRPYAYQYEQSRRTTSGWVHMYDSDAIPCN